MENKYQGTYNIKFLPFGSYNYGGSVYQACATYKPIDLRDVYLLNFTSYVSVFERKDGANFIIPTESIVFMAPTEKMEEPTLEVKNKYKVVANESTI